MFKNVSRLSGGIVIAAILLMIVGVIPAFATVPLPTAQTIDQIEVYRHAVGETNSQLWLVRYNCTTTNTTPDMSSAYLFVLKDSTTNVTTATTTAYPYFNNGYANGIISFEFTASAAPTWSGNYTLYFYGNPTLSWAGGTPPSINSSSINWIDEGTVADAQDRLTTRLRYLAQQLETSWGVDLIETTSSGTVFTSYGEDYFENSILGLRSICPDLFYQTMSTPEVEKDILITDFFASVNDAAISVNSVDYCAQTFIPSQSYDITGVDIPAYRVGNPLTLTLSIRAVVAGLPSGANLVTGTYDVSTITTITSGEWLSIAFTTDLSLTAGTSYAIVATTSSVGLNQFMWLVDTGGGYANGHECRYTGGVWAAVPTNDLLFQIEARNAITLNVANSVEDRLVGTQFDFTNWAAGFGLSRIWWSTIFWIGISAVIMVAASFGANAWDCSIVVLVMMLSYGWRGGWVDTIVFALILAILSGGIVYAVFWKKT